MGEMSLIYVVCENTEQAKNIAKNLLQKKLCACVNIIDKMQSMVFWPADSEEIQEADETILLLKTIKENFSDMDMLIKLEEEAERLKKFVDEKIKEEE